MVIYQCDRCGGKMMGRPTFQLKRATSGSASTPMIDLCENCRNEFEDFLNDLGHGDNKWTSQ